jgi:hypothetical protein
MSPLGPGVYLKHKLGFTKSTKTKNLASQKEKKNKKKMKREMRQAIGSYSLLGKYLFDQHGNFHNSTTTSHHLTESLRQASIPASLE